MIDYRDKEKQVKEFFEFLSQYTQMTIDLHLIKHESLFDRSKSLKFTIAQNIRLTDAFKVLKHENVFWKNDKRLENVYWSWSKNQKLNIAFVDDLVETELFKVENHLALIQTSTKKYQGLFLLDQYITDEELKTIQRLLRDKYNGDMGALSPYQLKRLVGFVNTKYSDGFVVRLIHKGNNVIETDKILQVVRENKTNKETDKVLQSVRENKTNSNDIRVYQSKRESQKKWTDFDDSGDESRTDMKYTLYLLSLGHTDEEIKNKLLEESRDIHTRKGKYVHDYLNRTIQKARLFFSQNQQTPKPMKKPKSLGR